MNRKITATHVVLLVIACAIYFLAADIPAMAEGERPKLEKKDLKKLRKQAANRARRIIYNDDGCHGVSGTKPEDWLAVRIKQATNTQVDTISYCTGGGGVFWAHQAKAGEVLGVWVEEGHGAYVKQMRDQSYMRPRKRY